MISVRTASILDAEDLRLWRNDESTRAASVSRSIVSWADHVRWFTEVLADDRRRVYISEEKGEKVGMCRFDLSDDDLAAEVSINLNPEFRGRGLARPVLKESIARFRSDIVRPISLTATIRPSNGASIRLFGSVGFEFAHGDELFKHYVG